MESENFGVTCKLFHKKEICTANLICIGSNEDCNESIKILGRVEIDDNLNENVNKASICIEVINYKPFHDIT